MALTRMHREQPCGPPCPEEPLVRLDRAAQLRDVVAKHFAEAAWLEKVALHVDDEQRAMVGRELEGVGLGGDLGDFAHPRFTPGAA